MNIRTVNGRPLLERSVRIDRAAVDVEARTVELAFSSETPVERWWGNEILDHAPASVRLERLNGGAHPLLVNHDPDRQPGVVEQASIDTDRRGRAKGRFGKSAFASEIFQDVQDEIRSLVSVGYVIHRVVEESKPKPDVEGATPRREIGGEEFLRMLSAGKRDGTEDELPTYRVVDWEPYEISLVAIPADATVGIGRSIDIPEQPAQAETTQRTIMETTAAPAPAPQVTVPDPRLHDENARKAVRLAEVNEIIATGEQYTRYDGHKLAAQAVREGKDIKWFTDELLKRMASPATETGPSIGLTDKEVKRYSVSRAILGLIAAQKGDQAAWKAAAFERECHDAVIKQTGREPQNGGILVPYDVQARRQIDQRVTQAMRVLAGLPPTEQRDLTVSPANAGGYIVATDNLAGSFIDLLRNRSRVVEAGAVVLPGLKNSVTIPKQTAAGTFYWLSTEATSITESQLTLGQLALSPKNGGAYTEISHQLMIQSAPAADMLVMDDLSKVCALGVDSAAIAGSGAAGQPTGIINTAGIGAVTGTTLAYAGIIEFQTDVASANALSNQFSYMTTPAVAGLLMSRQRFASTDTPLWNGNLLDATMAGFPARATVQMPAAAMLGGDFSQVLIGEWGGLELALNPFANFQAGIIGIRAWVTIDIGVRVAGAFSYATTIT